MMPAEEEASSSSSSSSSKNKNKTKKKTPPASASKKKWTWKKPEGKPKRPLSAYNFFFQHEREKIVGVPASSATQQHSNNKVRKKRSHRKTHGKIGFQALAKTIAEKWSALDEEYRNLFEEMATVDKERYEKELLKWRSEQDEVRKREAAQRQQLRQARLSAHYHKNNSAARQGGGGGMTMMAHHYYPSPVMAPSYYSGATTPSSTAAPLPPPAAHFGGQQLYYGNGIPFSSQASSGPPQRGEISPPKISPPIIPPQSADSSPTSFFRDAPPPPPPQQQVGGGMRRQESSSSSSPSSFTPAMITSNFAKLQEIYGMATGGRSLSSSSHSSDAAATTTTSSSTTTTNTSNGSGAGAIIAAAAKEKEEKKGESERRDAAFLAMLAENGRNLARDGNERILRAVLRDDARNAAAEAAARRNHYCREWADHQEQDILPYDTEDEAYFGWPREGEGANIRPAPTAAAPHRDHFSGRYNNKDASFFPAGGPQEEQVDEKMNEYDADSLFDGDAVDFLLDTIGASSTTDGKQTGGSSPPEQKSFTSPVA